MDLNILWFILITVLFTGFFVLEGFDYGVGMLLAGRSEKTRNQFVKSIGSRRFHISTRQCSAHFILRYF